MYLCLVFAMHSRLFISSLWSPAGKGLTSWPLFGMLNCIFVTFPCGILGQVWYLIVLVPNLCHLSYFVVCDQQRHMSSCAYTHFDHYLCYPCNVSVWFNLNLVTNHEDTFSHDAVTLSLLSVISAILCIIC